ncbi:P-loop containing nucleoside triphosphate hydrolase protein [Schizophyllum commune]
MSPVKVRPQRRQSPRLISTADDSPRPTHIPELDAIIRSTWDWGNVMEIQGPPACGKTHMLYSLLANCIIPTELGGWGKAAVLCDTDGTFDPLRFRQVLVNRLLPRYSGAADATDKLLRASLQRLHVFRPSTSNQLAITLAYLPAYHSSKLPNDEIGILAIDSLSAFHWSDRFTVEQLRAASERGTPIISPLRNVLKALRRFRDSHRPIILLTNWGLSRIPHTPFFEQHLRSFPSPFANPPPPPESVVLPLTHHITLSRRAPKQLREGIALEEAAEQERALRRPVIEKGEITGLVRIPGQSGVGQFTLRIGPDGVHVKQDGEDAAIE